MQSKETDPTSVYSTLICLEKQYKFKRGKIKERRWEAARLHIKMDCDSTPELYHQSAPVSTFAEPRIKLLPGYFSNYLQNALPADIPSAGVLNNSFSYQEL